MKRNPAAARNLIKAIKSTDKGFKILYRFNKNDDKTKKQNKQRKMTASFTEKANESETEMGDDVTLFMTQCQYILAKELHHFSFYIHYTNTDTIISRRAHSTIKIMERRTPRKKNFLISSSNRLKKGANVEL